MLTVPYCRLQRQRIEIGVTFQSVESCARLPATKFDIDGSAEIKPSVSIGSTLNSTTGADVSSCSDGGYQPYQQDDQAQQLRVDVVAVSE